MRGSVRGLLGTVLALGLGAGLSGCSAEETAPTPAASESPTPSPPAPSPPAPSPPAPTPTPVADDGSPAAAYVAWLDALRREDAVAACARHAPDFTIALRYRAILLDRAELGDPCTGFVAVLWEDPAREHDLLGVEATQVTGERARLAADFAGVDETVTLEKRNGSWFVAETVPRVDAADGPERWLAGWCALSLGSDRGEVVAVMGAASGEYTVENGGEPQLYWARRQYDFRAYLDPDDRVIDLVGDYDALSATDRERLPCPELR